MKTFLSTLGKALWNIKLHNEHHYDASKPHIIMPNHVSLLDPFVMTTVLPDHVYFVSNTQIAKRFKHLFKGRNVVTVDFASPFSVRKMIKLVKEGKTLVLFPEGRVTTTGNLMKIYNGLSFISLKTGVPILPVQINGAEMSKLSYLKGKRKQTLFPDVTVTYGKPFTLKEYPGLLKKDAKAKAADELLHVMQNLQYETNRVKNSRTAHVNLFNEYLRAASYYDMKQPITKDINGAITYGSLTKRTHVLSELLRENLRENSDTPIGLFLPNSIACVATLLALFKLERTPAMLNYSMGIGTLKDCLVTVGVKTILTSRAFVEKGGFRPAMDELNKEYTVLYLEDIAANVSFSHKKNALLFSHKPIRTTKESELILFTSGSESMPKGVCLTHSNLMNNIHQSSSVIDFTSKDKILNALPIFHSFGLTMGTLLPLLKGVPSYQYPSPLHYKTIPELCYLENATILFGTSTFLEKYGSFAHQYDYYSLRYVFAGAEKLKESVRLLWLEKFGLRIFEGYGITETSPVASINTPLCHKKGTVGRLLPGMEWKLEPVEGIEKGGNLLLKGDNILKGYYLHGKGFVPHTGWYSTGDLVEIDDDGYLTIKSRLKRFAKIAGEMISLGSVEEQATAFCGFPIYAVNVNDERRGEKIVLFGKPASFDLKGFREYLTSNGLTPLMAPKSYTTISDVPLLGSGKTDYVSLTKLASEKGGGS